MKIDLRLAAILGGLILAGGPACRGANETPYKGQLSDIDRQHAKEVHARIDAALAKNDFAKAMQAATELHALRRDRQGAEFHETVLARHYLETLRQLSTKPAAQRQVWLDFRNILRDADRPGADHRNDKMLESLLSLEKPLLELLGADNLEIASLHTRIGMALYESGKPADAEKRHRQAWAILEKVLGDKHPEVSSCWNEVGLCLWQMGKLKEAEALLRRALETGDEVYGPHYTASGSRCNNLGVVLDDQGRHVEAETLHRRAVTIFQALGEKDPLYSNALNLLAFNLNAQGKYAAAEPLFTRALALRRDLLGNDHSDTAMSANNLAHNLHQQGKYADADPLFREAVRSWEKALGDDHPLTTNGRGNLAVNLDYQDKYAESEPLYRRTLAQREKQFGPEHPLTANSCNNLGLNLNRQKKYAEGDEFLKRSLAIREKALGPDHAHVASSCNNLAHSYSSQNRFAEAVPLNRRALEIHKKAYGIEHSDTVTTFMNLAFALEDVGLHEEKMLVVKDWTRAYEAARLGVTASGLDRGVFGGSLSPWRYYASCLAEAGRGPDAFAALENDLARGMLDEARSRLGVKLAPAEEAEHKRTTLDLENLQKDILALVLRKDKTPADDRQLADLLTRRQRLESDFAELAGNVSRREVLSLEQIQKCLGAETALLIWVDDRDRSSVLGRQHWACVVRGDRPPIWVAIHGTGPERRWTAEDSDRPAAVRSALARQRPESAALLRALALQRWTPVRPHLDGVRQLLVVPTGAMAAVPVEALLDANDSLTVGYIPSGTSFGRLKDRPAPSGPRTLLAVGDPVFPTRTGPATDSTTVAAATRSFLAPLPGTRREIAGIAGLADQAVVLLGPDANKRKLTELREQNRLASFRYLHFATHGLANHDRAFTSALVLAHDRPPDGAAATAAARLTAREVLDTWKLDADLVVLSACESGLGRQAGGDGFLGFSQAFLLAGSRSVVLSLWHVNDTATSLLMIRFYENLYGKRPGLDKPMTKAEALKEAKHWLRHLSRAEIGDVIAKLPEGARGLKLEGDPSLPQSMDDKPLAHPYYWSAFILIGDAK